jgi:hypothetical protein
MYVVVLLQLSLLFFLSFLWGVGYFFSFFLLKPREIQLECYDVIIQPTRNSIKKFNHEISKTSSSYSQT